MSKKEIRDKNGNIYVEKNDVPEEITGPDGKTYIRKKPLHKRWYFWVLIAFIIIFVVPVVLSIITAIFVGTSSSSTNKPLSKTAKVAKNNWKNNKLVFKDGTFTIDEKYRSERYEEDEAGKRDYIGGGVMIIGTFKNKTDKPVQVTSFMNKHLKVRSVTENGEWILEPNSYSVRGSGSKQQLRREKIAVEPNESVKCGVNFDGEYGKNIPNDIYFKIRNNGKTIYKTNITKLKTQDLIYGK